MKLTQGKIQEILMGALFGVIIGAAFVPYFLNMMNVHIPLWIPGVGGAVIGIIYAIVPKGEDSES